MRPAASTSGRARTQARDDGAGGKSPNIVFDDAEIDNAVKGAISGIFAATGQTCIAGSRLLVQQSIHDQFLEKLVAFARRRRRWGTR